MATSSHYDVSRTLRIAAPADRVYAILADYHVGHPSILPPQFRNLMVIKGGHGAGTVTNFEVHAFGRIQKIRHEVFEPEPGRVLMEQDLDSATTTRFILEPVDGGTNVTILTHMPQKPGIAGLLEKWLSTRFLRGLYKVELGKLNDVATRKSL
jgi:Polyketide cyclase / dehydrase and lipid transport